MELCTLHVLQSWGDGSVGKEPPLKGWGPEFDPPEHRG